MQSNLFPEELQQELAAKSPLYSQDGKYLDAIVYYHFFIGNIDFYITEGNQEGEDFTFFGMTCIFENELDYISLRELEQIEIKQQVADSNGKPINALTIPVRVEMDKYWQPCKLNEIERIKNGK